MSSARIAALVAGSLMLGFLPASIESTGRPLEPMIAAEREGEERDAEFPGPYDWGVITDVPLHAADGQDVRVTKVPQVGDPAACQIQSETSVIAHGQYVYVAFNDRRDCMHIIGASWTGFARSDDGGQTFTDLGPLPFGDEFVDLYGDPVLAVDTHAKDRGTLYLASLGVPTLALGVSRDHGKTFTFHPVPPSEGSSDKEWLAVDNTGGKHDGRIYLAWINLTPEEIGEVHLDLSYSDDAGRTWSSPVVLATGFQTGVRLAIGPRGEVHAVWEDTTCSNCPRPIRYSVSRDGGKTFSEPVEIAKTDPTGHRKVCLGPRNVLNGDMRTQEFPSLAVDTYGTPRSNPHHGTVYVAFSDRGSGADESDVYMSYLSRGTDEWSSPSKVNDDDTSTDQFFPEIAATGPGEFAMTWTDRREDSTLSSPLGNRQMRQYMAFGSGGGRFISTNKPASETLFPPPYTNPNVDPLVSPCYAGDYNGLYTDGRWLYSAWADQRDDVLVSGVPSPVIPDPNVYFRKTAVP